MINQLTGLSCFWSHSNIRTSLFGPTGFVIKISIFPKFWSTLKKNTLVNINFNAIFVMSFSTKKLIWMNTIQLFILHQLMKSQWKMKMSSKKSSWCCAIYYYSLTQTSILWNGNCASGYRALKVSSNLEKFQGTSWKFLRNCAGRNKARNCASGYVEP